MAENDQDLTRLIGRMSRQLMEKGRNAQKQSNQIRMASRQLTRQAMKIRDLVDRYQSDKPTNFPDMTLQPVAQAAVNALPAKTVGDSGKKNPEQSDDATPTGKTASPDVSPDLDSPGNADPAGRHSFLNL